MLKHIVMWRFLDDAEGHSKTENMDIVKERALALVPIIPQVKSMQIGKDILHTQASYDFVLIADFENDTDLKTYINHPDHKKVGEYLAKVTAARVSIDCLL
jgi:hypothetical protein